MTREEAEGSTETAACRFWIVSLTVTRCGGGTVIGMLNLFMGVGGSYESFLGIHVSRVFWGVVYFGKGEKVTQSPVALAISSPTFLGDRPRGPILRVVRSVFSSVDYLHLMLLTLGARADDAPTSPPVARRVMTLVSEGSNLGGILCEDVEGACDRSSRR